MLLKLLSMRQSALHKLIKLFRNDVVRSLFDSTKHCQQWKREFQNLRSLKSNKIKLRKFAYLTSTQVTRLTSLNTPWNFLIFLVINNNNIKSFCWFVLRLNQLMLYKATVNCESRSSTRFPNQQNKKSCINMTMMAMTAGIESSTLFDSEKIAKVKRTDKKLNSTKKLIKSKRWDMLCQVVIFATSLARFSMSNSAFLSLISITDESISQVEWFKMNNNFGKYAKKKIIVKIDDVVSKK